MTKEWFREIPFNPNVDDPADAIVEMMATVPTKPVDLDPDKVRRLIRDVRHVHRLVLSEWNRRHEPGWKPPRSLKDIQVDGPEYDYGEMAGLGLDDWDEWWKECWGAGPGNPGRFRDGSEITKKPFASDIPKAPLVAVYHSCNRFWRRELRTPFRPDFRAWDFADQFHGRERLEFIGAAALFFVMIAWAVDEFAYTVERCAKVHDLYYRKLNTNIPK